MMNQPVQETGTGVDVVLTNTGYTAIFGKNSSVSGSGLILAQVNSTSSCKRILETNQSTGDRIYTINPQGISLQVYCDMTTD